VRCGEGEGKTEEGGWGWWEQVCRGHTGRRREEGGGEERGKERREGRESERVRTVTTVTHLPFQSGDILVTGALRLLGSRQGSVRSRRLAGMTPCDSTVLYRYCIGLYRGLQSLQCSAPLLLKGWPKC